MSVTRSAGSTSAVTADIGTLPGLPSEHFGYALQKSSDLPLEVLAESGPACDRTVQVRDAIVAQVSGVSTCGGVTDAHLAAITSLDLGSAGITSLKEGDFSASRAHRSLDNNSLSNLPAGVFRRPDVAAAALDGNAVDPLPVAVSLEPAGFSASSGRSLPRPRFALTLPVSVFNGEIDGGATTLTIPAGMVHSDSVSVTRSAGSTSAVTADIGTLPGLPSGHRGYALQKSSDLPLEVLPSGAPFCDAPCTALHRGLECRGCTPAAG